ncbi:hypothetical protein GQ457_09G011410 [Hibiscus cannabinus]
MNVSPVNPNSGKTLFDKKINMVLVSFDHNLIHDLVTLGTNDQITIADSSSFDQTSLDQSHHSSSASLDWGYIWIWCHRVRMGKSLPLRLTNLRFEGYEP